MRPNIIVFLSDQQRYDTIGMADVFDGVTPNLDKLCQDGACFENCFSVNPICAPARASLQSGKYPSKTGNFKNGRSLPFSDDLLAVQMSKAGYETAYIGKWHLYNTKNPFKKLFSYDVPKDNRCGYSFWQASNLLEFTSSPYSGHLYGNNNEKLKIEGFRSDYITKLAIDYINNQTEEKPFFLFISQLEPHQQNNKKRFFAKNGTRQLFENSKIPKDLEGKEGDYREFLPDYLGACHNLDQNVREIVNALKKKGIWDNTVFIYSSDHGCHFKTRNKEYKRSCHDSSIRVPLIIHGKPFEKLGKLSTLTTIMDIPATIISLSGQSIPKDYDGKALDKGLNDENNSQNSVFIQISESQIGRAIRTSRYKLSVSAGKKNGFTKAYSDVYYEEFLYDLEKDPHENNNLISSPDYNKIKESLKKELLQRIEKIEGRKNTKIQVLRKQHR